MQYSAWQLARNYSDREIDSNSTKVAFFLCVKMPPTWTRRAALRSSGDVGLSKSTDRFRRQSRTL